MTFNKKVIIIPSFLALAALVFVVPTVQASEVTGTISSNGTTSPGSQTGGTVGNSGGSGSGSGSTFTGTLSGGNSTSGTVTNPGGGGGVGGSTIGGTVNSPGGSTTPSGSVTNGNTNNTGNNTSQNFTPTGNPSLGGVVVRPRSVAIAPTPSVPVQETPTEVEDNSPVAFVPLGTEQTTSPQPAALAFSLSNINWWWLLWILLAALIITGGMYYWQRSKTVRNK